MKAALNVLVRKVTTLFLTCCITSCVVDLALNCTTMTVIQWLNGTSFEGPERTESYQFAVGFTKGNTTFNARDRDFTIQATRDDPTGKIIIL